MLSKIEIFNNVQHILLNDYAGCKSKAHLNTPEHYNISNDMSDSEFEYNMQQYLLDFKDGHLWFNSNQSSSPYRGFSVRRHEDKLYVTDSPKEIRLFVGDEISLIDNKKIESLSKEHRKILEDDIPERQLWSQVLSRAEKVIVSHNGQQCEMVLHEYERPPREPEYFFKSINNQVGYMKVTDFLQAEPIEKLVSNNQTILDSLENLIIDVRVNHGGNDSFYFPLLHYIFDETITFAELFSEDDVMYTNFTKANYDRWVPELEEYLKQNLEKDTRQTLQNEIALWKKNKGKGFLEVSEDVNFLIKGRKNPLNIYVLSDYFCGSSGETFVRNVKKSPKVTVLGRPTMGIMDIFNVIDVDFGEYNFCYGISKSADQDAYNGIGVQPDVYIPWTPHHLEKDVDLEYALNLIKQKELG